jgi:hypothetical protein
LPQDSDIPESIITHISDNKDPEDQTITKMRKYGWKIEIGQQEEKPEKKYPYYDDNGIPWESEDDYRRHIYPIDKRKEQEEWEEEYLRRRNDPYWKNDSDFD